MNTKNTSIIERNIYKDFSDAYVDEFVETLANGCSGGLYGDVIEVYDGKEGLLFTEDDIKKFIRFQHGDNDYHDEFSNPEDELLSKNIKLVVKAFLLAIDTNFYGRDFFINEMPHLIPNIKITLTDLVDSTDKKLHTFDIISSCPKCNSSWIGDIGYNNAECWMCGEVFQLKSNT